MRTNSSNWQSVLSRLARYVAPLTFVGCLLVPVRNRNMDLLIVAALAASWVGWLVALRRKPLWCGVLVLGALVPGLFLLLPARQKTGTKELGDDYVRSLERYVGTPYWWGGETALGIDCSGLIRAGMMDACLKEGLRTWDGSLVRHALDLWWHDESAKALGEGYRDLTSPVTDAPSLNALDLAKVQVGDLAIAGHGLHILAYLGSGRWIQADPNAGKVIIEAVPSKNSWMQGPVRIVRWSVLR